MGIFKSFSRGLTLRATSLLTVIALAGCVPIEGEAPKVCDKQNARPYGKASDERCKMVKTKSGVTTTGSAGRSNY